MKSKAKGQLHGLAVRRSVGFGAQLVLAFGKDVVLNMQRGGGYVKGFVQGVVRGENALPNA